MTRILHPVAGTIALLIIVTFWLSTALAELLGTEESIITVKTAIPWGFSPARPGAGSGGRLWLRAG